MLRAVGVSRHHGGQVVLDRADLTAGPRSRIGVVGRNGVGKSTLLRILAGLEAPDGGTVDRIPSTTVGYLPQEPVAEHATGHEHEGESLRAYLARRTGVAAAEAALDAAAAALSGTPSVDDLEAHADALDRFLVLGGDDLDARAGAVLADVGLAVDRLDVPVTSLSGGQQARMALAAILLSRFDVFLLDEPTNDLDFAGLERLERFIDGLPGGLVVVSHDRAFLDRTVERIVEIDEGTRRTAEYAGGWSDWVEARALARSQQDERYEGFVTERDRLGARLRAQRSWSEKGLVTAKKRPKDNDRARAGAVKDRTEKQAGKVRITEQRLVRLERDAVDKPFEPWQLQLSFAGGARSGDLVARLDGAVVERGGFRLGPVDLAVAWQDRIGVVGPNGGGKSTLLAALLGTLPLAAGRRTLGPGVVVGTMDQQRTVFNGDAPVLTSFFSETGLQGAEARTLLAKFGLGADHVGRSGLALSPGERSRALLAVLSAKGVNCLVLDEPTNHLDVEAIEQLEQALDAFDATLLLVSHDRRLLDEVRLTRTVEVIGGQVRS